MNNISTVSGTKHVKFIIMVGIFLAIIIVILLLVSTLMTLFIDEWNMPLSVSFGMTKGLFIPILMLYLVYRFSRKLVKVKIKNNTLYIEGNKVLHFSNARILEINFFSCTIGMLKIDDNTYYFLPQEFYVFRFYYFTKNLRNLALIKLKTFLDDTRVA
ncbi:MAG: hypothetical protein HRT95_19065 [Moritella sp.]|uniref:hypothetical protein n=1 Tax=Moritella sp. TaxID=78556 RepID=UPI001D7342F7|nr:hypothetical protein [Moritella sp.]NQZ52190.1 hypothetical protein [Moritella sp.]